jgi:hypothetical protein
MAGHILLNSAFYPPLQMGSFRHFLVKMRLLFSSYKIGYGACLTEVDFDGVKFNIVTFLLFFMIFAVCCVCDTTIVPKMCDFGTI